GSCRSRGIALALLPVPDRVERHVDAPREFLLCQSEAPPDAADEARGVLHRLGIVLGLLDGKVGFSRRVQLAAIDPALGKGSRPTEIDLDAYRAHTPRPLDGSPSEPR